MHQHKDWTPDDFIHFATPGLEAGAVDGSPIVVDIGYEDRYCLICIAEADPMRMLTVLFKDHVASWQMIPAPYTRRDLNGSIFYGTLSKWRTCRCTKRSNCSRSGFKTRERKAHPLTCWARQGNDRLLGQAGKSFKTGTSLWGGQRQIEYWFPTQLDPVTTEPIEVYLDWLNIHWQNVLVECALLVAQLILGQQI
jgi:hypothetical protein